MRPRIWGGGSSGSTVRVRACLLIKSFFDKKMKKFNPPPSFIKNVFSIHNPAIYGVHQVSVPKVLHHLCTLTEIEQLMIPPSVRSPDGPRKCQGYVYEILKERVHRSICSIVQREGVTKKLDSLGDMSTKLSSPLNPFRGQK